MKNVTGYDLCKLMVGSHGTLAAMTELTFKVLPVPEESRTVLVAGLADHQAVTVMGRALSDRYEVSAAAHLPAGVSSDTLAAAGVASGSPGGLPSAHGALTLLRVEGTRRSVDERAVALRADLVASQSVHALTDLDQTQGQALWRELRDVRPFVRRPDHPLWRLSLPPASAADVVRSLERELDLVSYYDWGGALVWLGLEPGANPSPCDAGAGIIRSTAEAAGGRAQLIRAPDVVRQAVGAFHPEPPTLAGLTARLRESFDPGRILNPGRT